MLNIDLHCHSTVSDGLLTPTQLVEHAARRGVSVLALTDHDDVGGLGEARRAAAEKGITFINGVEISVSWRNKILHIVGLDVNPEYPPLAQGLEANRSGRILRARNIAAQLDKFSIHGSLEGAYSYAGKGGLIGRTHFARFLVERGYAKDVRSVFKKYLVKGKPGYVDTKFIELCGNIACTQYSTTANSFQTLCQWGIFWIYIETDNVKYPVTPTNGYFHTIDESDAFFSSSTTSFTQPTHIIMIS